MTNIASILDSGANVQIVVNAADLREAFLEWATSAAQKMQEKQDDGIPGLMTADEVCGTLGVNRDTLRRWEKTGYLTPKRIGGGFVRYCKDDVKSLLK